MRAASPRQWPPSAATSVYVERLIRKARHIEVQIIGDHHGAISHLWERECTIQRRNQKLIEVAPSPSLSDALRARIIEAAKELAAAANYDNLGTFEFLVDDDASGNERSGVRLHRGQSAASGRAYRDRGGARRRSRASRSSRSRPAPRSASLGLAQAYVPKPRGFAMQLRVNMEVMDETGGDPGRPAERSAMFDLPSGPGVRVDTFGYSGYRTSAAFDSLLAKVIVHSPGARLDGRRAQGGADPARIPHRRRRHQHPVPRRRCWRIRILSSNRLSTGFIDTHVAALVGDAKTMVAPRRRCSNPRRPPTTMRPRHRNGRGPVDRVRRARSPVPAPLQGTIVAIDVGGRGSRPSGPADRRARIHEDGASGDGAAWRQGDEGRG